MRLTPVVVGVVLALCACGGGSDDAENEPDASSTTAAPVPDDTGDLFEERDVADGDQGDDPSSSEPSTSEEEDASGNGDDPVDDASTGGTSSDDTATTDDGSAGSTGGDASTGGASSDDTATTAGDATSSSTGGSTAATTDGGAATTATTSTTGGTSDGTIDPDDGGDVCQRVQDLADALDRVSDVEFDTGVDEATIRDALEDVIAALDSVAAAAPADVAADVELSVRAFELEIAEDLDDRELTDAELDFLVSEELADAGDGIDDFAVGVCGVELS